MSDIKVSVCIITYKHENYIRQCLDSVFMQKTNFDFEVIVGEDASPDGTRKILLEYKEKYGDKLILALQDKNIGGAKNSACVGKLASGKYIALVEGDDFWTDENKLQKQYDILENHPEYSAVCHDIMGVDPDGNVQKKSYLNMKTDCIKSIRDWLNEGYSVHTCSIFRRRYNIADKEKYAKLRTAEPTMGDVISFTLLYDMGDIYVLKDVMAAHRAAGEKDTSSYSYTQKTKAIELSYMYIRIVNNLDVYLEHKYDLTPMICNRIAAVKLSKLFRNYTYDSKEMKKLMKSQPIKVRVGVYKKLVRLIWNLVKNKLREIYAR